MMANIEVHYRNRSQKTFRGGKMSDLLEEFSWLRYTVQVAARDAYDGVNERQLQEGFGSVLVRFVEASEWDLGIDDFVFVIKCGQNGMSEENQQRFCDIFDSTRITTGGLPDFSNRPKLSAWLRDKGVSYSVELFNYCSHGFGKTPDRIDEDKSYRF